MPGIPRRIDPDRELAKLQADRERLAQVPSWPVLIDEVHQVPGEDGSEGMIFVHIRVAADRLTGPGVPVDLGTKLTEVIAANWPVRP